jgi:co-chaperonin GroES (HSP10)
MKPVLHRVLVKKDPIEKKTESGIVLALNERSEKKATVTGTVVDIGSTAFISFGSTAEEQGIKVGTRVYFAKYAGADIDDELTALNDEDVIAVITEEMK